MIECNNLAISEVIIHAVRVDIIDGEDESILSPQKIPGPMIPAHFDIQKVDLSVSVN
jgi:hypothetical protein